VQSSELRKIAKDIWLIEGDASAKAKGEQPDVSTATSEFLVLI
jgi:hypothetical protein